MKITKECCNYPFWREREEIKTVVPTDSHRGIYPLPSKMALLPLQGG